MSKASASGYRLRRKIFWGILLCFSLFALGFAVLALTFVILGTPPTLAEFFEHGLMFILPLLPAAAAASLLTYRICRKKLEQKTKEISEAGRIHLATVEALATAIDARDQAGAGHARRTQIYAVGLGRILGLNDDDLQALNTGALLHDIGQLAVPDHILNKPGSLTPAEMEKIKIHAEVGASILEKVKFTYPVAATVKYHHEHWDGSGYPENLRETQIPLPARVLAVADFYDTLRVARSYRSAVSREDARQILRHNAGIRFDPQIVDLFLRNLPAFEAQIKSAGLGYQPDTQRANEPAVDRGEGQSKSFVEQINRANREIFTLYELARTFSSSLNLEEALALFVKKIGELVPFDTCVVYLLDKKGAEAEAVYAEGRNSTLLRHRFIKPGEGATGTVLEDGKPIYSTDPALDFTFASLDFAHDYSSMTALPLIADEKLLGVVSLYSCTLKNYEDEHRRLLETVALIASDAVSKLMQHAESESRALTDPLTGLPNARSLQIQFDKEVARADRNGSMFQLLMLDLDGFKEVNDTFGHKTGDNLLKEIARIIREELRDYDFLARYAGDEFIAIIPETDRHSVLDLCHRLEEAVGSFALPLSGDKIACVGISIGAASYPSSGRTLDQIVIAADQAMYKVKARRKEKEAPEFASPVPSADDSADLKLPLDQPDRGGSEASDDNFIVEIDESHIISSAVN